MKSTSMVFCGVMIACLCAAAPSQVPKAAPKEFPHDWSLEEIAKSMGGGDGPVYVLAWCRTKSDSDSLEDTVLAVRVNENKKGFLFNHLYRNPDKETEWHNSMSHATGGKAGPLGMWYIHYKHFDKAPNNVQLYEAMDFENLDWSFTIEKRCKIVSCGVCEKSWKDITGEKPTKFFDR